MRCYNTPDSQTGSVLEKQREPYSITKKMSSNQSTTLLKFPVFLLPTITINQSSVNCQQVEGSCQSQLEGCKKTGAFALLLAITEIRHHAVKVHSEQAEG